MEKQNTFGDAFSCSLADYTILQDTIIGFKCPKSTWRKEFEPGSAHEYAKLRNPACFDCEHKAGLKQYEIIDGKCKEIKNET